MTGGWILPPSYEKDQSASYDAEREHRKFIRQYKESRFVDKAKPMLLRVSKKLAEHEWYVARFDWERGKPMRTVLRLRRLLDRYPGTGLEVDAMWLLGQVYIKALDTERPTRPGRHSGLRRAAVLANGEGSEDWPQSGVGVGEGVRNPSSPPDSSQTCYSPRACSTLATLASVASSGAMFSL
ncbi:MAG TPA: outer membrane protein assembly factor BamD [Kofleriaceae bacterium]|nr:outer membrane protein assembly factor BamD [Kofleriaceae bacterium]